MRYHLATNTQLKSIVESDGQCPSSLLHGVLEEAIRRDIYKNYITRMLNNRYKAIRHVERLTKLTFEEIKNMCYEQAFKALEYYKPGKCGFLSFWVRFMQTAISNEAKKYRRIMRTGVVIPIDDIVIVDDKNTERKALNRIEIREILSGLDAMDREIVIRKSQDYNYTEIGKMLGIHRDTVRYRLNKIHDKYKGA